LGRFDERMWLFFSDMDFSRRVRASGRTVLVCSDVVVRHRGGGSVKELTLESQHRQEQADYVIYARKWFGGPGRLLTVIAVVLLSGVFPAMAALSRRDLGGARTSIKRPWHILRAADDVTASRATAGQDHPSG
jgi:GT2 family glycosyltransferase